MGSAQCFRAISVSVTLANNLSSRYDADDSANHTAQAAPASTAANPPPVATEPVTEQPSAPTIATSIETGQQEQFGPGTVHQSLENGNNQMMGGDAWDGGQGNDPGAMSMKHEAQGTGIKEDG